LKTGNLGDFNMNIRRSATRCQTSAFIKAVREATRRFHDVSVAEAEGYELHFGCVSGSDWGAMGLHFVNMSLVGDGELDPARPEIVPTAATAERPPSSAGEIHSGLIGPPLPLARVSAVIAVLKADGLESTSFD
jgi:hypothetical protein